MATEVYSETVSPWDYSVTIYSDGHLRIESWGGDDARGEVLNGINTGDFIHNCDNYVRINAGGGDDTVRNLCSHPGNYVTIHGDAGNDDIDYKGYQCEIYGDANDDTINNSGANSKIYGGTGKDHISNSGEGSKIYGDANDDTINNSGDKVKIDAGDGINTILNHGNKVEITTGGGGEGKTLRDYNEIISYGSDVKITGSDKADHINVTKGDTVEINSGGGDDTIVSNVNDVKINAGDGNNEISNGQKSIAQIPGGDNVEITAGENDDTIKSFGGSNIKINAGDGKNEISLAGSNDNVEITTGTGEDKIILFGDDSESEISGNGSKVTINTGNGENFVNVGSGWDGIEINGGDEADGIFNESDRALIQENAGINLIINHGDNAEIFGGKDGDQLINYGNNVHIHGDDGKGANTSADYIYTDKGEGVIIDAGKDDDIIEAYHDVRTYISGGAGNDQILMQRLSSSEVRELFSSFQKFLFNVVDVYAGFRGLPVATSASGWLELLRQTSLTPDKLLHPLKWSNVQSSPAEDVAGYISLWNSCISASDTFEQIVSYLSRLGKILGAESTVNGGAGNDVIVMDGIAPRIIEYSAGEGNDEIYFGSNQAIKDFFGVTTSYLPWSTLYIKKGNIDAATVDDNNNVILKVDTGSVKLVNAAGLWFKVRENGKLTTRLYGNNEANEIYSVGKNNLIINGMGGSDNIINTAHFSTISGGDGDDTVSNYGDSVKIDGGAGNDYIYGAGYYVKKYVTINGGADDDTIYVSYVKNALIEYNDGDGNDIVYGFDDYDTLKINAVGYTTERKGWDLIVHVGDGSINLKGCRFKIVNINSQELGFFDGKLDADKLSLLKLGPNDVLDVNEVMNEITIKTIDASNNTVTGVKVIGNVNINKFMGSKAADVYYASSTNSANEKSANNDEVGTDAGDDVSVLTVRAGGGDDTIYGGEERPVLYVYKAGDGHDVINYFGAKDTLRILGETFSIDTLESDIVITVGDGSITLKDAAGSADFNIDGVWADEFNPETLTLDDSADSSLTVSNRKTIDASARENAIQIAGNNLDNSITGGAGDDTLTGEESDDTLTGGDGNDLFVYTNGNDVITDYAAGDEVSLAGMSIADITGATVDGDITLTFDDESTKTLTISDAADKNILINGTSYAFADNVVSSDKSATLAASFSGTLDANNYKAVDASAVKEGVLLAGGISDGTSLLGGKFDDSLSGGSGADTLNGGDGNDSLTGGDGADLFVYSDGDDTITDYAADDEISLAGLSIADITDAAVDDNNVMLTFNEYFGTLTINDAADKDLLINGEIYRFANGAMYTADTDKTATLAATFGDTFDASNFKSVDASSLSQGVSITGGTGNGISILGSNFDDSLFGTAGADTLNGSDGNDSLSGGEGNDRFIYSAGNDVITDYVAGDEISLASLSIADITGATVYKDITLTFGGDSGKTLTITDAADKDILINGENYRFAKNAVADTDGNATLTSAFSGTFYADNYKTVNASGLSSGVYLMGSGTNNVSLLGSSYDDTLGGRRGNDTLTGGAGNDLFVYSGGNDVITDYTTDDKISLGAEIDNASLYARSGILTFGEETLKIHYAKSKELTLIDADGKEFSMTVDRTFLDDDVEKNITLASDVYNANASTRTTAIKVTGNKLNNSIVGGSKNDTLYGKDGYDTLIGGEGNDKLYGQNHNDYLYGGYGNDTLDGGEGNDILYGEDGNDKLIGGKGNDYLYGGYGDDTLSGGAGNDYLWGGSGEDLFVYSGGNDVIEDYQVGDKISLGAAFDNASLNGSNVVLNFGNETLTIRYVKGMELTMIDAAGKEFSTIVGGMLPNNDSDKNITLAANDEFADASARTTAIKITGNKLANSIVGGSNNDSLYGNNGDDTLLGGEGNDKLYGQNHNDYLYGGTGNDTLDGGNGNDYLYGEDGDDTLSGGAGNDYLYGGYGDDLFVYSGGNDVIEDYQVDDRISLGAALSSASLNGNDAVLTFGNKTLTIRYVKGMELTMIDAAGEEYSTVVGGMLLDKRSQKNVTLAAGDEFADASSRKTAIKITGNALDNSIVGGTGKDSLYGDDGDDTLRGGTGSDKLFGQNNNDYLYGENGSDTLDGGAGDDYLYGGNGDDLFIYSGGNDVIADYQVEDQISLGAAFDNASLNGSNAVLTFGNETLTIRYVKGMELTMIDAAGEEYLTVVGGMLLDKYSDKNVTLAATDEFADASARTKAIKITGNKLANSIVGGSKNDTLYGNNGDDTLRGGYGNDKLYGQNHNDTLYGGNGNDTLDGGNGNDYLSGDDGDDKLIGGAGDDTLYGGNSNDTLDGGNGNDYLSGGYGDDTLDGGAGDDYLYGGSGDDLFIYSGGNDIIDGYEVGEKISLGAAIDNASLNGDYAVLTFGNETLTIYYARGKELTLIDANGAEFKTVIGGMILDNSADKNVTLAADDEFANASARKTATKITGNALNNSIVGGTKNDTLYGKDGDDTLYGGLGNDKLYGQNHNDYLYGENGDDTLDGGAGNDYLDGGAGNDSLNGNTGNDWLYGYDGNDKLLGGKGDDYLYGGYGNDSLNGGAGNDYLYGEDGDDTLNGGTGNDLLWGGYGADVFVYEDGDDLIEDFDDNDLLQITGDFTAAYDSSTNTIVFRVGQGSITLENFSATNFHVNDDIYKIDESTFEKQ